MRIALFATNHYQFIAAVNLKMTIFKNDDVHLFSTVWPPCFEREPFDLAYRLFDREEYATHSAELNNLAALCFFGADDYADITRSFFRVENEFNFEIEYDMVLTHGFSFFAHWVYARSYMKNSSAKLALFGDGTIFTFYPTNYFFYKDFFPVWKNKKNTELFEVLPWFIGADVQYLYRPEFISENNRQITYQMVRIPQIKKNGPVRDKINSLYAFGDTYVPLENYTYIFFDSGGLGQVKCLENEKEMLMAVSEIAGRENILIRQHPRSPEGFYDDLDIPVDRSTPCIEHIYLNIDISEKILIGAITTALHTPYEIFDEHPRKAVILNNLARYNPKFPRKHAHDDSSLRAQDELVNTYCSQFPEVYVMPKNWDDLPSALSEAAF